MKLAVSNIAWDADDEPEMISELSRLEVPFIEVAPPKAFADPSRVDPADAAQYRSQWEDAGIGIAAFQSLLFARPDLLVFESAAGRAETIDYLSRIAELAGRLGAKRLVFGSPKSRRVPDTMSVEQADAIAADFFLTLARAATDNGTTLCIEPNPREYGCNFVTTTTEGARLVERVDHPGFGLHLDTAAMTLEGENLFESVQLAPSRLKHFHISAPHLGAIDDTAVDHAAAAAGLRAIDYDNVVSIEMRASADGDNRERVATAVAIARRRYGSD